jgi:CheY-like chemotaxis protein
VGAEYVPHRCSVLVVDDDPAVRELLMITLQAEGYGVAAVSNGREALHYLRSHAETCSVVIELVLPVMDALHFRTVQLRDRSPAWIPIVVMSGAIDGDRRARELGARSFVRKPLNLDELGQALRRIGCCQARPRAGRTLEATPAVREA